jgi:SAM-dependent MidA family methyltransferase
MADALWTARAVPAFGRALSVHLVETSPVLREQQKKKLARAGVPIKWHNDVAEVPDGPLLVLANEFFDALPVHQVVKTAQGWHERMVGVDPDDRLAFALHPESIPNYEMALPAKLRGARAGAVHEWRSDIAVQEVSRRIAAFGGAALVVDYGHAGSGLGDTLQAVREHGFVDPLSTPGEADLTAHVDFEALAQAAARAGARAHGAIPQGDFLRRVGIEARAAKLKKVASPKQAADVDSALIRLTGAGPDDMGALFKVLALAHPQLGVPPGFDT